MTKYLGIDYFGRNHFWAKMQIKSSLKVRRQIFEWLSQEIGGVTGKIFLEHGATPDTVWQDSNCFIRWLIEDGAKVYATSPEDIYHLKQVFPGLETISYPPSKNDFKKLDCIVSSAVLEHVGSEECQIGYLSDLLKLHNRILLTTPNRFHWLEFHTKLPVLHWLPKRWHRAILSVLGMKFWANEKNLNLLYKKDLVRIIQTAASMNKMRLRIKWDEVKFLGRVSNHVVLLSPDEKIYIS